MGAGVEMAVESVRPKRTGDAAALQVRLLGIPTVSRGGDALALPASRKARALFAYLALAPHAVTRTQLCELLWDVPNDPRGELRWCLSKIRHIVDEPDRRRVDTPGDSVRLDLTDCFVDAIEVARAMQEGIDALDPGRLRALAASFNGDFLDGLEIDRSPVFNGWLTAQRRRYRGCHTALLERLVGNVPDDEAFGYLEKWVELAPFDQRVHEMLLNALARRGRVREGEEHLAATVRLFEAEGMDHSAMRAVWQAAKAQIDGAPRVQAVAPPLTAPGGDGADAGMVASRRASIAVMPFVDRNGAAGVNGGPADGLAHDVITRLAKLRTLSSSRRARCSRCTSGASVRNKPAVCSMSTIPSADRCIATAND